MGAPYYQFCPVAKAMELLDERWTLLVIRELLAGSQHFNELRRGLPRMSPALLSKRLHQLTVAGLVIKSEDGSGICYRLSDAGRELEPIVVQLGAWGVRWIGEIGDRDLDPKLLMWDLHRHVDPAAAPQIRTVLEFDFADVDPARRRWWLVFSGGDVDVCDQDPGFDLSVTIRTTLRMMIMIWRGDQTWERAARNGTVTIDGAAPIRRLLPKLFLLPGQVWSA
ncbi:helix-turn-helix transcriptional regulator [Microlunatus elymi]|uniref:Helix-turn-helix transcriptional regulator n=1 Tax=Microlunatus elymi TaxID=2596828 RepID=A0A516Q3K9_9ACTN|nr:helix-turn-helix domain-containing protein [Microlunatus elymi]QDP98015.1 helix-turn-helix transcriptional regulator [Microlunatus elymi]